MIRELSEMICLSHDFKKITERRTQYDRRAAAACLHMDQSNENISNLEDPDSKVTCGLIRRRPAARSAKAYIFYGTGLGRHFEDRSPRGTGSLNLCIAGDHELPPPIVKSWSSAGVNFIPWLKTTNGKETTTKTMILSASGWIHDHLGENGKEPFPCSFHQHSVKVRFSAAAVGSGDYETNRAHVLSSRLRKTEIFDLARSLNFHTLLAREKRDHHTLRADWQVKLVKFMEFRINKLRLFSFPLWQIGRKNFGFTPLNLGYCVEDDSLIWIKTMTSLSSLLAILDADILTMMASEILMSLLCEIVRNCQTWFKMPPPLSLSSETLKRSSAEKSLPLPAPPLSSLSSQLSFSPFSLLTISLSLPAGSLSPRREAASGGGDCVVSSISDLTSITLYFQIQIQV
ncbi:hypothetical protein DY000_02042083 [Brassica cretica]|uniref:Uncharacterized protein n=1 Tax=Brassica cretica TaxID=69181 RepID=A0ABQ7BRL1_BRACR|nr:hypothetical protein DY000_02042083 [Brassica cretica]